MIYLDYAASTPLKREVLDEMLPFMTDNYGNASSVHGYGRKLQQALEASRRSIAKDLKCSKEEIYFVSSGTEADNWAIKGMAKKHSHKGKHIVVSAFEHPAVLNTVKALEEEGFEISYAMPNTEGIVTLDALKSVLRQDTILVSIMMVNNEIGSIQPLAELGHYLKKQDIFFHSDGVQALGYLPLDLSELPVDLMSFSGHKIYGPVGIGVLYIKKGIKIKALIDGGAQERQRRAGTSNVAGAVGFAKALHIRSEQLEFLSEELRKKRDYLYNKLKNTACILNAGPIRHPGNLNVRWEGIAGDTLLMNLDLKGIAVSSGSACSSGALKVSHVLKSIGLTDDEARASIRISLGDNTSYEELDQVSESFEEIIDRLKV